MELVLHKAKGITLSRLERVSSHIRKSSIYAMQWKHRLIQFHHLLPGLRLWAESEFWAQPGAVEHQVKDDGRGEEWIFTAVVQHDVVLAAHEDLRGVLIHGSLAVPNVRHILQLGVASLRTKSKLFYSYMSALCTGWTISWRTLITTTWSGCSPGS